MSSIVSIQTSDVRFPTSLHSDGSDAMNPDPDYSAAYLRLVTDAGDGHEGPGFVVTIGRGNDVQLAAVRAVAEQLRGEAVVDHLHEHFVTPTDVRGGRYWPPTKPGAGTEMLVESVRTYTFAGGDANG